MVTPVNPPYQVVIDTPWVVGWRPEFIGTLLFVLRDEQVLLIHKKTGHGAGKINAPGGKLELGEGVIACACREVFEEVGLTVHDASVGAEMRFVERDGPQWLGFALTATDFSGALKETSEAKPFWCPVQDIPYADMWPDDALWLPKLLDHRVQAPIIGNFLFDNQRLLGHEFDDTDSLWSTLGE